MTTLIILFSIVLLVLIIALFSKKGYAIEREIVINSPKQNVFDYLKHIKNQDNFSVWVMKDPHMKKTFSGTDGTVGFIYGWSGNKQAGEGEQEIKTVREGERLDLEVRFIRPFKAIAQTPFETESFSATQTKVKWGMISEMNYPMNILLLFMNMDKLLGKDLETSLNTLKTILEKK